MRSARLMLALLLLAGGCARATSTVPAALEQAAAENPERTGDSALVRILGVVPLDSAAEVALQRYELDHPISFLEAVGQVAEDPGAGMAARYNAVRLLGERTATRQMWSLRSALEDRDPRVRAAAVVAAGRILDKTERNGMDLVKAALEDSAPEVQAKALEVLGQRDVPLLRDFLARHPAGEAAAIARGLLQAAEERGAPLAADSAGVLRRITVGGLRLEFRPVRSWPEWGAAVGTVTIGGGTSPAVTIPDVEMVSNVVPVFFSPDESAIVYEQGRRIYVRELRTGGVRDVGTGIAPRPLPFSEDFMYVRVNPASGGDLEERTRINYDVLRAGFRPHPEDPRYLGSVGAFTEMKLHANYSPMRWARIFEKDGKYTLEAAGAETFKLPDPFKAGTRP